MRRLVAALLLAVTLFPITVSAKGGGGFSSGGSGRSGGFSSPSRSYTPSTPSSRPQAGTFSTAPSKSTPALDSHRAGERASSVYVHRTTVVNGGGSSGGGSILPWLFLGYYAGGGCNRDRQAERQP